MTEGSEKETCSEGVKREANADRIQSRERRRAVKKIVGGMGVIAGMHALPDQWARPLVDAVVLPAHGATSPLHSLSDPCQLKLLAGDQSTATVTVQVTGFVIPPTGGLTVDITATPVGGAGGPLGFQVITAPDGTYDSAGLVILGGPGITAVIVKTTVPGDTAECSVLVPAPAPVTTATTTPFNPPPPPEE
jgi:hypothetical protein